MNLRFVGEHFVPSPQSQLPEFAPSTDPEV
jgi:hypothetical protein